jgi:hypothetical protein
MDERRGSWGVAVPSGLFPGQQLRPVYREPHPINPGALLSGIGAAVVWFGLFAGLARDLASYAWWTLVAAVTVWVIAAVLAIVGDRGVAVGVALVSGFGLAIACGFVTAKWITSSDWPMW